MLPLAVSEGVGGAIAGSVTALVAGGVGIVTERFKHDRERLKLREAGFERAQTGYRACYRKFLDAVAACLNAEQDGELKPDQERKLYENFDEAVLAGDPLVAKKLLAYWPSERRGARQLPEEMPPASLVKAMVEHGSRTVHQQDELKNSLPVPPDY